ncbi:MAG: FkbM family methyltransferase [Candidatus Competibacteraceae bacterium]
MKSLKPLFSHPVFSKNPIKSISRILRWQFTKRIIRQPIVFKSKTFLLKCYPDSHQASGFVYFNGYPEFNSMSFVESLLRPGDRVLDVGANIGVYTLFCASLIGTEGVVDAFEPAEIPRLRLLENLALNGFNNVTVHNALLSDQNGPVGFADQGADCSVAHIVSEHGAANRIVAKTLDEMVRDQHYLFGKMDIEGAEPLALQGARIMLAARNPPIWQLEFDGYCKRYGWTSDRFAEWLLEHGYRLGVYDGKKRQLILTQAPWLVFNSNERNVLAVSEPGLGLMKQRIDLDYIRR